MRLTENDIGKTVTILKKPQQWSSHFTDNYPLNLKYPFTGVVEAFHPEGCLVSGYGFSVEYTTSFKFEETGIDYELY